MRAAIIDWITRFCADDGVLRVNAAIEGENLSDVTAESLAFVTTFLTQHQDKDGIDLLAEIHKAIRDKRLTLPRPIVTFIHKEVKQAFPFIRVSGFTESSRWTQYALWQHVLAFAVQHNIDLMRSPTKEDLAQQIVECQTAITKGTKDDSTNVLELKKLLCYYLCQKDQSLDKYTMAFRLFLVLQGVLNESYQSLYATACEVKCKKVFWVCEAGNGEKISMQSMCPEGRLGALVHAACCLKDPDHFSDIGCNTYPVHRLPNGKGWQSLADLNCPEDPKLISVDGKVVAQPTNEEQRPSLAANSSRLGAPSTHDGCKVPMDPENNDRIMDNSIFAL